MGWDGMGWAFPSRVGEKVVFSPFTFFYRTLGLERYLRARFRPSGAVMKLNQKPRVNSPVSSTSLLRSIAWDSSGRAGPKTPFNANCISNKATHHLRTGFLPTPGSLAALPQTPRHPLKGRAAEQAGFSHRIPESCSDAARRSLDFMLAGHCAACPQRDPFLS